MAEKIGLVLEGGGAKGAYEIGACKALEEIGINITAVTGTSVGALNGALVAQHEIDKAYRLWSNIELSQVMNIEREKIDKLFRLEINPTDIRYYLRKLREIITEGGIDVSPLQKLIKENINEEKLRKSDIDFGMVTVSLTNRRALELFVEDIPKGQIADYLFASANFPLFRSAKIDDKVYLDGGIYDNLPMRMLVERGYKSLITIQVGGLSRKRKVNTEKLHIIDVKAKEHLGGTLNFSGDQAQRNLKLGYFDAYRVLKNLAGQHYYVELEHEEDYFLDYFSNLNPEVIITVAKTLGLERNMPERRLLFEKILPKLVEIFKLPENCGYQDIALTLVEKLAQEVEVDRFQIYSFSDLIDAVLKAYSRNRNKKRDNKKEESIVSYFGFLSLFSGNQMLKRITRDLLNEDVIHSWHGARDKTESSE